MKLLIDITDEEYKDIKDNPSKWGRYVQTMIGNGIPYEERPKGEWEDMSWFYHMPMYKCTHCNYILEVDYYPYCPHCGADMRGDNNE